MSRGDFKTQSAILGFFGVGWGGVGGVPHLLLEG